MCLPACRIIQTGVRSADCPRATRSRRGSRDIDDDDAVVHDTSVAETNNANDILAIMITDQIRKRLLDYKYPRRENRRNVSSHSFSLSLSDRIG